MEINICTATVMSYVYLQILATFTVCSFVGSKTWEELYFSIIENYLQNLLTNSMIVTYFLLSNPIHIIYASLYRIICEYRLNSNLSLTIARNINQVFYLRSC